MKRTVNIPGGCNGTTMDVLCSEFGSVLRYAMQCYATLCYATLLYAMLGYATICYATLCYAMIYYAMIYYAMLRHAIPRHAMLCYTTPCYATLSYATSLDFAFFLMVPSDLKNERPRRPLSEDGLGERKTSSFFSSSSSSSFSPQRLTSIAPPRPLCVH